MGQESTDAREVPVNDEATPAAGSSRRNFIRNAARVTVGSAAAAPLLLPVAREARALVFGSDQVSGEIVRVSPTEIMLDVGDGERISVDLAKAQRYFDDFSAFEVGERVRVFGPESEGRIQAEDVKPILAVESTTLVSDFDPRSQRILTTEGDWSAKRSEARLVADASTGRQVETTDEAVVSRLRAGSRVSILKRTNAKTGASRALRIAPHA